MLEVGLRTLFNYFNSNWNSEPFPIIDHALRIEKLPEDGFHFYIHPAHTGGITADFVIYEDRIEERKG